MKKLIKKLLRESLAVISEPQTDLTKNQINFKVAVKLSQAQDVKDVSEWMNKPVNEIEYFYKEEPISMFVVQIREMESTYDEFGDDRERTEHIYDLLNLGAKPKAIFVELNDPNKFIMEGRHRIVAFSWRKLRTVPVVYVR